MRSTASIQIGFKVTPDIAAKLEAVAKPLHLSRSLVAKELVLAALANQSSPTAIDLFKHRPADAAAHTGNGDDQERTEADDLMQDLLHCLKTQNEFLDYLRLSIEELDNLRRHDIPSLRSDIRTSVAALLCQSGASVELAKDWVTKHLGVSTREP